LKNFKLYIDNIFKKKFIKEFKLSIRYLILFILKLNGESNRFCINYKKLNDIIIKN